MPAIEKNKLGSTPIIECSGELAITLLSSFFFIIHSPCKDGDAYPDNTRTRKLPKMPTADAAVRMNFHKKTAYNTYLFCEL